MGFHVACCGLLLFFVLLFSCCFAVLCCSLLFFAVLCCSFLFFAVLCCKLFAEWFGIAPMRSSRLALSFAHISFSLLFSFVGSSASPPAAHTHTYIHAHAHAHAHARRRRRQVLMFCVIVPSCVAIAGIFSHLVFTRPTRRLVRVLCAFCTC